ncbi:MAG: DNA-binding protein [Thermoplasmata archaeon]
MNEDDDEEIQRIRLRKLRELEEAQAAERARLEKEREERLRVQSVMRRILSPEAKDRLARVRIGHPEIADWVESHLFQLAAAGKIKETISEETLLKILEQAVPKKREINIRFK